MVFLLGIRHGMDPDHLATIDGLTRFNSAAKPRLARWSGMLFSLGHGAVVMGVAALVSTIARSWVTPGWLEAAGSWISIGFLYVLGAVNLIAVAAAPPGQVVAPVGVKGRWLGSLQRTSHPFLIALVGALFALSFDTVSQAALFSAAASTMAGWPFALVLGFTFMVGMMCADGINGLWIARLIRRADQRAAIASRIMGLILGMISLAIGTFALAKQFSPAIASFGEGRELLLGFSVIAVVGAAYFLALRLARNKPLLKP